MSHIQDLAFILRMRDERVRKQRIELAITAVCVIGAVLVAI